MFVMETARGSADGEVAPMVDNILQLEMLFGDTLERTIRIVKTRASGHDGRRHALRITPEGIVVDRRRI